MTVGGTRRGAPHTFNQNESRPVQTTATGKPVDNKP